MKLLPAAPFTLVLIPVMSAFAQTAKPASQATVLQQASQQSLQDHMLRGDDLASKGDYRKAIEEFGAAIRLEPSNAQAHWSLAKVLDGPLPDGKAINLYNLAVRYNKGNQDDALKEYQSALRLDPKLREDGSESAERHSRHAAKYLGSNWGHWTSTWCGDFSDNWINHCMDNAITEYRIALLMDPNNVPAHVGLGVVLEKLHKHDAAIEELRAALRLDPQSADGHFGLGHSLEKKGNLKEALQEYGLALSLEEGRTRYEKLSTKLGMKKEQSKPAETENNNAHLPALQPAAVPTSASESAPEFKVPASEQATIPANVAPSEILRDFKSYYIKSDTIYLHRETLHKEMEKRTEFAAWSVTATDDPKTADVVISVTLPFMTWEWNYRVVYQPTGAEIARGKVSAAVEQTAAPQLAAMIVKRIGEVRPLPASFQAAQNAPRAPANQVAEKEQFWKVKYVSGSWNEIPIDSSVTLSVNARSIAVRGTKNRSFSIPALNVRTTHSRTEIHKATKDWEDFWDTQCCGDNGGAAALFIAPIWLAGEGILAPMKTTDHFVSMYWVEEGRTKNAEFRVGGRDVKSLLTELNKITGKNAEDLQKAATERQKLIAEQYATSPIVEIKSLVRLGWNTLAPGEYRMAVIPRAAPGETSFADVYFFAANKPTPDSLSGNAVAEFERRELPLGNSTAPAVSYDEQNGNVSFSQIETNEFVLRFTLIPLGAAN